MPTRCDFDGWTPTAMTTKWLGEKNATKLLSRWGFDFWENPITGDQGPVLATRQSVGRHSTVWNTQDFDLPTSNPMEAW